MEVAPRSPCKRLVSLHIGAMKEMIPTATFTGSLPDVTHAHLRDLGQTLWDWQLCDACHDKPRCSQTECRWSRAGHLESFRACYSRMTAGYIPEFCVGGPALRSHAHLRKVISNIRTNSTLPRHALAMTNFGNSATSTFSPQLAEDRGRALNMAASLLLLSNCGSPFDHAGYSEDASLPMEWENDASLTDMMHFAFPQSSDTCVNDQYITWNNREGKTMIAARNLRKKAGITCQLTNDLRGHLAMDPVTKVVSVFYCTSILHELLAAHDGNEGSSKGFMLPRSLLLEALDTIHEILFPSDHESQTLLESLMDEHGISDDMIGYKWACYQPEAKRLYPYFGERLSILYEEVLDPSPRNGLELWLEKKSSSKSAQRNMLLVTMIGVILAVFIGFLSLVVAIFATCIAWQQWRNPV